MAQWCTEGFLNRIGGINDPSYNFRQFSDNNIKMFDEEKYCMYLKKRVNRMDESHYTEYYNLYFGEIGTDNFELNSAGVYQATVNSSIQSEASEPHEKIENPSYPSYPSYPQSILLCSVAYTFEVPNAAFITDIPIFDENDTDSISDYVKNGQKGINNKGVKVTVVIDPNGLNFEVGLEEIGDEEHTEPTDIDTVRVTITDNKSSGTHTLEFHDMNNINSYSLNRLFYDNVNLIDIINRDVVVSANFNVGDKGVAISSVAKGESKNAELQNMPCVVEYSESNEPLDGDSDNRDSEDFDPFDPSDNTVTTRGVLTTTYKMTNEKLIAFGNWLWNLDLAQVGYAHVNDNPIENVVSLKAVPFSFATTGSHAIKLGNLLSPDSTSSEIVSNETTVVERIITVGEILSGQYAFMNYGNYTKVQLYAPFFGLIDLANDDVIGTYTDSNNKKQPRGIKLRYTVDCVTGECTLEVRGLEKGNIVYSATTNCGFEIPLFATNRAMKEQAIVDATDVNKMSAISNATNILNSAINPSVGGAISTLGASLNNAISQDINLRQAMAIGFSVSQKGQTGGKSSCNIYSRAYVIVTYPNVVNLADFQLRKGRPVMKTLRFNECRDFIKFDKSLKVVATTDEQEQILANANLTNEFKEMIYNYLTTGVYYTP